MLVKKEQMNADCSYDFGMREELKLLSQQSFDEQGAAEGLAVPYAKHYLYFWQPYSFVTP